MGVVAQFAIDLEVSDVSAQKKLKARVPPDSSIGELIQGSLGRMHLPPKDADGQPLTYQARLAREGRQLHGSERVGDVLKPGDQVTLQPNIDAGGDR